MFLQYQQKTLDAFGGSGECRVFGQLSLDPADFELEFMLINAEAVGPGVEKDGTPNIARIGLSVRNYTAEIVHQ